MAKTIYWAVILTDRSSNLLKTMFKPEHPKVFAEHITICFGPTEEQEQKWSERLGEMIRMKVVGEGKDKKGHAVVVTGIDRDGGGIPHVTISCAKGTKPFYSNALLSEGYSRVEEIPLAGTIARYTKNGWETEKKNL